MKPKYIVEVTTIDLIFCKTKEEVKKIKGDNLEVYNQRQFKEAYGEEYERK